MHDYGQFARVHAHGLVKTVIKDFLDMEVEAIDPMEEPPSGDLTISQAKELCIDRICLFRNIQLWDSETKSESEMCELVKVCEEQGEPNGNFVALPTATPLNAPLSP